VKINYYHNEIKDSLIAHLTLVGHNGIINSFGYSVFQPASDKRFLNVRAISINKNRFDHPVYMFPLLIIHFSAEAEYVSTIF
jgi:hypothetical protein